jgi:hypothetical protein
VIESIKISFHFHILSFFYFTFWQDFSSLNFFNKSWQQAKLKQGVCDTVALPFTLKKILRQKKKKEKEGNSN